MDQERAHTRINRNIRIPFIMSPRPCHPMPHPIPSFLRRRVCSQVRRRRGRTPLLLLRSSIILCRDRPLGLT